MTLNPHMPPALYTKAKFILRVILAALSSFLPLIFLLFAEDSVRLSAVLLAVGAVQFLVGGVCNIILYQGIFTVVGRIDRLSANLAGGSFWVASAAISWGMYNGFDGLTLIAVLFLALPCVLYSHTFIKNGSEYKWR